jgi:hypothetical protein
VFPSNWGVLLLDNTKGKSNTRVQSMEILIGVSGFTRRYKVGQKFRQPLNRTSRYDTQNCSNIPPGILSVEWNCFILHWIWGQPILFYTEYGGNQYYFTLNMGATNIILHLIWGQPILFYTEYGGNQYYFTLNMGTTNIIFTLHTPLCVCVCVCVCV